MLKDLVSNKEMKEMAEQQDGMKAALTCKKLVPSIQEDTKDGTTEKRQLVLKGDFLIFEKDRREPTKLPVKLEFKDEPGTVELVQRTINVQNIGEKCLLTLDSNKHGRLDEYMELAKRKTQVQLDNYLASLPAEDEEE